MKGPGPAFLTDPPRFRFGDRIDVESGARS
jgi:hypothetical protein